MGFAPIYLVVSHCNTMKPNILAVNDKIKFTSFPYEWSRSDIMVHQESRRLMKWLVHKKKICKINNIDEYGNRWVNVNIWIRGKLEEHTWAIMEESGWELVK